VDFGAFKNTVGAVISRGLGILVKLKNILGAEYSKPLCLIEDHQWGLARNQRDEIKWLIALLTLALAVRMIVAYLLPSVFHPDELFQYWEQGHRLAFGDGVVPWEFRDGIRSWILPGFIGGVMMAVDYVGGSPLAWRLTTMFILSVCSLAVVATAFFWAKKLSGLAAGIFAGFLTSIWYELVYFAPKPLTEAVAASLLFPAAYLLCASANASTRSRVIGGLLLGLIFVLRFHLAPAIMVIGIASMILSPWPRWLVQVGSAAAVVALSGLLDWYTWDYPFQSIWYNFYVNAVQGKSSNYGVHPFIWYILLFVNYWAGLVIPLIILMLFGVRRAPLLLAVVIIVILSHSFVGHKEYRFMIPIVPFVLTLAAIGTTELFALAFAKFNLVGRRRAFLLMCLCWMLASVGLAASNIYRHHWINARTDINAFLFARTVDGGCGVGAAGMSWWRLPGYTYLARQWPIYYLETPFDAHRLANAYNVLVYEDDDWGVLTRDFRKRACFGKICVAVRQGSCVAQPNDTINKWLIKKTW